jgi:hypothetical protein
MSLLWKTTMSLVMFIVVVSALESMALGLVLAVSRLRHGKPQPRR